MLSGVVLLLVIAHAYRFALNIYQVPIYNSPKNHAELHCCGRDATNQIIHIGAYALLTLSCSGNCFIYLATSKPFRDVVFNHYKLLFSSFCSTRSSKNISSSFNTDRVNITERKENVTSITPFGLGFKSRGIAKEENIRVAESKKATNRDEVMNVSVLSNVFFRWLISSTTLTATFSKR